MHERFHYETLEALQDTAASLDAWLPIYDDVTVLQQPITIAGVPIPNRIALQPMEGTDADVDGSPGALTYRRYHRFAAGGAGVLWVEAVAIAPEVRASPNQLYIHPGNVGAFARLTDEIRKTCLQANGFEPLIIVQATHSGRYAKPTGVPQPQIAYNNPVLEDTPLPAECILTDDALMAYEERFGVFAKLAREAGFDGMDIKCCHRYLACELLSAFTRKGSYGGSFENRTRFLRNAYAAAKASVAGDFILTSRLNVYDGFPYPYGFGVSDTGDLTPDLTEPIALVSMLSKEMGVPLLNITLGNPYKNPHVNRPYDHGGYIPNEHPLLGVSRAMQCADHMQQAFPTLPMIGSAFSYLRQYAGNLAAGMVAGGHCALAGFGRMAFAYPDFPNELRDKKALDAGKVCIACGQCAQLLRAGKPAGCVVRDDVYQGRLKG